MTTPNTTANTNIAELTTLFTNKATDIQQFIIDTIKDSKIVSFPSPDDVNKVFQSLPKQQRDKTTYALIFTMASLHSDGKLQPVLTKAINTVADKETGTYELDKALSKFNGFIKAFILLGVDMIDTLSTLSSELKLTHEGLNEAIKEKSELRKNVKTLTEENEKLTEENASLTATIEELTQ